jgi:RimJ/RimL family protein N-acetyltransferase
MELSTQLFESPHLRLDFYDLENDPIDESSFTYDLNYAWAMDVDGAAHPLSVQEIRKKREAQLKEADESKARWYFAIRRKTDRKLIGVLMIPWISWNNRTATFRVAIGDRDRRGEYLVEALEMALRYAFEELGLFSIDCFTGEFQPEVLEACRQAGMVECVRQRDMVYRGGRYYDRLMMVMQFADWQQIHPGE